MRPTAVLLMVLFRCIAPMSVDPRYTWPDDSLVGTWIPCSEREAQCLRYNRLYDAASNSCYPFLDGPSNCVFVGDKEEFLHGFRHLRGKCLQQPPCCLKDTVSTISCQVDEIVKAYYCNGTDGKSWTLGMFGNLECRCASGVECDVKVFQRSPDVEEISPGPWPTRGGRCRFPSPSAGDPLSTVIPPWVSSRLPRFLSPAHRRCLATGRVWVARSGACFRLHAQGPCRAGWALVLNRQLWLQGRVVPTCAPRFHCQRGLRRMAFDGKCHREDDVRAALRHGEGLFLNRFGDSFAAFKTIPFPTKTLRQRLIDLRPNCHATKYDRVDSFEQLYRRYG